MTGLFIVDTNILIAGLISSNNSPVTQIVDAMLNGTIIYSLSPALLQEYREVLLRPKLRKLHKLSEKEIDQFLTEIIANSVFCEPSKRKEKVPDRGDNHLLDLLQYTKNAMLITGDKLLLEKPLRGYFTSDLCGCFLLSNKYYTENPNY